MIVMPAISNFETDPRFEEYVIPEEAITIVAFLSVIVLSSLAFPGIVTALYAEWTSSPVRLVVNSVDEFAFITLLLIIHELIHYVASHSLGYQPEFGVKYMDSYLPIKEPSPYVVVLSEYISRNDNVITLSSPFIILNSIALISIFLVSIPEITYFSTILLVLNTSFSTADLYNVARILRMPRETVFINIDEGEVRTFFNTNGFEPQKHLSRGSGRT